MNMSDKAMFAAMLDMRYCHDGDLRGRFKSGEETEVRMYDDSMRITMNSIPIDMGTEIMFAVNDIINGKKEAKIWTERKTGT